MKKVGGTTMQAQSVSTNLNDPRAISEAGKFGSWKEIYERLYRAEYEQSRLGKFVAINILDESATLGNTATEALGSARAKYPKGLFHLIRVGHSGAFEVRPTFRHVSPDRIR
jgi:hypothetical protein